VSNGLRTDDIGIIAAATHKLKANSGSLSATAVSRCAAELESQARALLDRGELRSESLVAAVADLRTEFERARHYLLSARQ
jgi:HPt (histidine-containing phosphotransfer) domain-containing protein